MAASGSWARLCRGAAPQGVLRGALPTGACWTGVGSGLMVWHEKARIVGFGGGLSLGGSGAAGAAWTAAAASNDSNIGHLRSVFLVAYCTPGRQRALGESVSGFAARTRDQRLCRVDVSFDGKRRRPAGVGEACLAGDIDQVLVGEVVDQHVGRGRFGRLAVG